MKGILNKRNVLILVIGILIILLGSLFIKKSISKTPSKEGYTTISDVPGVVFDVKKSLNDTSTAVLEVSKNIDFIYYQTYKFKNGEDTYLLFNIKQFIVIAQKGTNFLFSETPVTESLKKNSLNGIWFELRDKEKNLSSKSNRYTYDVNAQVVITNAIYGDFKGKLSTIEKDGEEWALFVGTTGNPSEEISEMTSIITDSFALSNAKEEEMENYEISMDNGVFVNIEEKTDMNLKTEDNSISDEKNDTSSTEQPGQEPETNVVDKINEDEVEVDRKDNIEEIVENLNTDIKEIFEVSSNQKEYEKSEKNAYTSSIYAMLDIGDTGYLDLYSEENVLLLGAYIKVVNIYNANQTQDLIEEYINSGDSYYKSMQAPDGCHFEAIEYEVKFTTDEHPYVNISLKGLDGESLRHRGVIYSHMTYDILNKEETRSEWSTKRYCFYSVPNGCKEYVLQCGDGNETENRYSAYYHIQTGE